ncbi:hypothetical protein HYV44_00895 [Candidatus Microgenomates bacterium]|nr:hypothetical protein [Candidatus Microgenomates bacterium]
MLTAEDIKKLTSVLADKQDLKNLENEVSGLREGVQALTISVDGMSGSMDDLKVEYLATRMKIDRHERWIQQIADKVGVKLEV